MGKKKNSGRHGAEAGKSKGRRRSAKPAEGAAPAAAKPRGRGVAARLLRRKRPEPESGAAVEARALARFVRLSPQKARLVVDLIRGRMVGEALDLLRFTSKRPARDIEKVLRSAIANVEQKSETVDIDRLYVKYAVVNEGPRGKRVRPAPFGRAHTYQRRTSHIEIAVAERRPSQAAGPPPAAAAARGTP